MTILAVDDEKLGLQALIEAIEESAPDAEVIGFRNPEEALAFAEKNDVYAAFLDIRMPVMAGTELAKRIKVVNPGTYIIFSTGFDNYMGDAFSLHANGYLLKPITAEKVKAELDNLHELGRQYEKTAAPAKRIRFQCFGNFEAFADGAPVRFKYDKTKEILAYMVSRRGCLCSNGEIISNVWDDDDDHVSYLRGLRKDLVDRMQELGCEDVLSVQRGKMGVIADRVSCDYYDFLNGDVNALNSYHGEFMSQYSWGEFTNGELEMAKP